MVGLEIEKFKKLNEKKHKTFMYENVDLVLRRGLSFKMNLKFQEKIKKQAIFCELRTTKGNKKLQTHIFQTNLDLKFA